MNRLNLFLTGLLIASIFVGCRKDALEPDPPKPTPTPSGPVAVNLKANIAPSALKVAGDQWEPDDRVWLYMKKTGEAIGITSVFPAGANVQMNIDPDGTLKSATQLYYPLEEGNVDFVAYYPYTSSVSSNYTVAVDLAGQSSGLPKEVLYSANAVNRAPDESAVALNFNYSLAKLAVTVVNGNNSPLTVADFAGMTLSIEGMFTQAQLQLSNGTFTGHTTKQPIALLKTDVGSSTSATFEALVLPVTSAAGEIMFVFNVGNKSFQFKPDINYAAATQYALEFALDFEGTPEPKATLLSATIMPRTPETHKYSLNVPVVQEPIVLNVRKELRAAWITTVWAIDWPNSSVAATQQKAYTDILDMYQAANMNAVFMQVRGMADPYWNSQYESYSSRLTGVRGQEPSYDVVKFLIEEAHKRGMEFHAWFNPFRIATTSAEYTYGELDPKINPALVKNYALWQVYNPAIPEVQTLIADIVKEFITLYPNVDGIHMDDYFYVDVGNRGTNPGHDNLDDEQDFLNYYKGGSASYSNATAVRDWRRDNVTTVIQNIRNTIIAENPRVVFSVSPQSNESNNFNNLYADVKKWCTNSLIDMVIPQIYQNVGTGASSFQNALTLWASDYAQATNTPTLVGLPIYRILTNEGNFSFANWELMLELVNAESRVLGQVIYTTRDFTANRGDGGLGTADLMRSYYKHPAVRPVINKRSTESAPTVPSTISLIGSTLAWTAPPTDHTSVVYLIPEGKPESDAYIVAITKDNTINVTEKGKYVVSTFNRNNLESALSKPVVL